MKKLIAITAALILCLSYVSVSAADKAEKKSDLVLSKKGNYTLIFTGSESEPKETEPVEATPDEATPDEPETTEWDPHPYAPSEPTTDAPVAPETTEPVERPTYDPLFPTKPSPSAEPVTESPMTVSPTYAPATKPNIHEPTTAAPVSPTQKPTHKPYPGTKIEESAVKIKAASSQTRLNIRTATLKSGKRINLNVLNKNGKKVKFSSGNKKVAIVNKKGYVTALRKGRAKITAKVGKKKLRCIVKVTTDPKLSAKKVTVKKNGKVSVKITGKAKNIQNTYKNTMYAKVVSKRSASVIKVKGLRKGTAELKVVVNRKTLKLKVAVG